MRKSICLFLSTFALIGISPCLAISAREISPRIPPQIKILIRREQILDEKCRGPGGDEGDNNCSGRVKLDDILEKLGWCWDSEKIDVPEKYYHWIRCSKAQTIM